MGELMRYLSPYCGEKGRLGRVMIEFLEHFTCTAVFACFLPAVYRRKRHERIAALKHGVYACWGGMESTKKVWTNRGAAGLMPTLREINRMHVYNK